MSGFLDADKQIILRMRVHITTERAFVGLRSFVRIFKKTFFGLRRREVLKRIADTFLEVILRILGDGLHGRL